MNYNIGFIGAGKMANAIMKGIIDSKFTASENIFISDLNKNVLEELTQEHEISAKNTNLEVVKHAKIIIMAVKPFVLKSVLEEISEELTKDHLIISIAAGISISTIQDTIGKIPVIRVMPNTPALVAEGMSAICKGDFATDPQVEITEKIFTSVGQVIKSEEKYIDIITAISGSGPAFFYYVINEIAKAGEKLGLDYQTCLKLSAQTALGSAKMILQTATPPEELITNVTTPGGCTEVGNNTLKKHNISEILHDTIEQTMIKAKALGEN